MPRKLINNYTFYKIVCLDNAVDLRYVGSTADFNKRKSSHKSDCNNQNGEKYNYKVYKTIRENGGWSNFKMIEIAKQEQITLRQAEYIEEQYRVELNADMNDRRCFLTEEERKEYDKNWYEKNKAKSVAKSKKWRENNPEYIKEWRENNPEHNKEWRENNKEHIKEYNQTPEFKANRQTPEFKAKNTLYQKKYREKKKLEKEQLKNNKE